MKRVFFTLLATLSCSAFAFEDYNMVVGVVQSKIDSGRGFGSSTDLMGGSYYFESVKADASRPYAEAPFLQRVSSVTGFIANTQYESSTERSGKYTPYGVAANFYKGDYLLGVSLQDWHNSTRKVSNLSRGYDMENSAYSLVVGYFVKQTTSINYEHSTTTVRYSPVGGEVGRAELVDASNKISMHTVLDVGEVGFVSAGLSYRSINRTYTTDTANHEYAGVLRFYPKTNVYLEYANTVRYGDHNGSNGRTNAMALGVELNRQFDARLSNARFSPSDVSSDYDTNSWQVGVNFKF